MGGLLAFGASAVFAVFFVMSPVFAQTSEIETSKQTTMNKDLLNSPLAQEILLKIEESKRKIAKLEQQNYDNLEAQRFLEDRRTIALDRLNQDLILLEEEWYEFSPKVAYQKFLDKMPSGVKGIYAKQFEFTKTKHNAGVDAKTKALANGGSLIQGTQEFRKAAKSTVGELSNYNERIHPNYVKSLQKQIIDRIAYWDDTVNGRDAQIEKDSSVIERDHSIRLLDLDKDERIEIREKLTLYNTEIINRTQLTYELGNIREKYTPVKDEIVNSKSKALSELESKYANWISDTIDDLASSRHPVDVNIEITWNSDAEQYEVVSTNTVFSTANQPIITGLVSAPTEIQLFWKSPASIDNVLVTGYKIEAKKDSQQYVILVKDSKSRDTSYTHANLKTGEFYTYRISAIMDVEVSDPSNEIRASTASTTFDIDKELHKLLDK